MVRLCLSFVALASGAASGLLLDAKSKNSESGGSKFRPPITCGPLKNLDSNAKPTNYADARETFYNKETGKTEKKMFNAGDSVEMKCKRGFSTNAAKPEDTNTKYQLRCTDMGYYAADGATCIEASACGAAPMFANAHTTGKVVKRVGMPARHEYECEYGFSLDGLAPVEGGSEKTTKFSLDCQGSGQWTTFDGKCQPFSHVDKTKMVKTYNAVFETLWEVACKGSLQAYDNQGFKAPALDSLCSKFSHQPEAMGECEQVVSDIKAEADVKDGSEGIEDSTTSNGQKQISDEKAKDFCDRLYTLHDFAHLSVTAPAGE